MLGISGVRLRAVALVATASAGPFSGQRREPQAQSKVCSSSARYEPLLARRLYQKGGGAPILGAATHGYPAKRLRWDPLWSQYRPMCVVGRSCCNEQVSCERHGKEASFLHLGEERSFFVRDSVRMSWWSRILGNLVLYVRSILTGVGPSYVLMGRARYVQRRSRIIKQIAKYHFQGSAICSRYTQNSV